MGDATMDVKRGPTADHLAQPMLKVRSIRESIIETIIEIDTVVKVST